MKNFILLWRPPLLALLLGIAYGPGAHAQVPGILSYRGYVRVNEIPFDGQGQFKFALVNPAGTITHWSNDGTSIRGSEPTSGVTNSLFRGVGSVSLGDTTVPNMTTPIPVNVFTNNGVFLRVWFNDGVTGWEQLTPDQQIDSVGYAFRAASVADDAIGSAQLAAGSVQSSEILDGSVRSAEILDGTITTSDLNLPNVDARYVLKAGDTMSGPLSALRLNAANGLAVGTSVLDAEAVAQFNFPPSVSIPHVRLKSTLGNTGFGLQFVNPDERWYVGPNIGNWSDDRFNIVADSSNSGLVVAANGNVGLGLVSSPSPFTKLAVDGTIGFPTVSSPMLYIYPSGTANVQKPVIVHSPAFPGYGLFYQDEGDRFVMQSSPTDSTPSLVVDLDSNWVSIATGTPKPGYELSVNGQVVCEELLIQDSADWPDYVFEKDYLLKPLVELEEHIKERKHLPGIPTASEIARDGLEIGMMQKKLMEKIEELTLYAIAQEKRLNTQEQRIRDLESRFADSSPIDIQRHEATSHQ